MDLLIERFALIATILLVAGCGDVAAAPYDRCVKAEAANDLASAVEACGKAVKLSTTSPKGKLAAQKLAELRPRQEAQQVEQMTVLTDEFCAGLVDHLQPKVAAYLAEQESTKLPSIRAAPTVIDAMAMDYAKTKAKSCKDDVFYKRNVGYWKCQWLADLKDADDCKQDDRE